MSEETTKSLGRHKPLVEKAGKGMCRKTSEMELAPVEIEDAELDAFVMAVGSLGFKEKRIEELATGALKAIGMENGELTARGLNRVKVAIRFIAGLLAGKKHKTALSDAGVVWAQVGAFTLASPEFNQMYKLACGQMKRTMGMSVLDTAFELATEGSEVYYKGEVVGVKKSEKMLDKLLTLAGREFSKDGGKVSSGMGEGGGGIVFNFNFDGKKAIPNVETIDV